MSTSGTYTWVSSASLIINDAFLMIGRKGDHETLTSPDPRWTAGMRALNVVCKANAVHGMPLWTINEATIAFSSITTSSGVTIGLTGTVAQVAPLKILQAVRMDTTTDSDLDMDIYTYDYFESLPSKENTGAPLGLFYQPKGPANTTLGKIKVWPLPDSYWQTNGSLYIRYERPFQDMAATGDEPDFPSEWIKTLTYQVAHYLAPSYGIDMTQRQALKADMNDSLGQILGFGTEEGSFFIQPRTRQ